MELARLGILAARLPDLSKLGIWGAVMIAASVLLGAVLLWLKRKVLSDRPWPQRSAGFTLTSLEQMHRSGQISDEEFKALRLRALDLSAGRGEADNRSSSGPVVNDDEEKAVP